jgi:hypothetical protein
MGQIEQPKKAILFAGILHNPTVDRDLIYDILENNLGKIILQSRTFSFSETNYYHDEMGPVLYRIWIGFDNLIEQDQIVDIKLRCNELELKQFSSDGKRNVNIDPGYLTRAKVVLATTKNNQHRLYLTNSIYGEVTLRFKNKIYEPWEWTFPDYCRDEAITFFSELRSIYCTKVSA